MTFEDSIKDVLKKLIIEQSSGECDDETIDTDVELFYEGLWEYFKDDS